MRILVLATIAVSAIVLGAPAFAATAPVPCEDMLDQVRSAEGAANLTADQKTQVADLTKKGIDRCKADDDTGADKIFANALKIMGK